MQNADAIPAALKDVNEEPTLTWRYPEIFISIAAID